MLKSIHADVFIDDNLLYINQVALQNSFSGVVQERGRGSHSIRRVWVESPLLSRGAGRSHDLQDVGRGGEDPDGQVV